MDCKQAEKLIPDFIKGEMETRAAKQFLEHVKKCPSCRGAQYSVPGYGGNGTSGGRGCF